MSDGEKNSKSAAEEAMLVSRNDALPAKKESFKNYTPSRVKKSIVFRSLNVNTSLQGFKDLSLRKFYYMWWVKHPWIKSFIGKIAKKALTIGHYVEFIGEGLPDATDMEFITNFFNFPNDQESFDDILYRSIIQIKLWNETFWEVVKNQSGNPEDFYILDGAIVVNCDEHGRPKDPAYAQKNSGKDDVEFAYDEIIWFKYADPLGDLRPHSDLEALEPSILLDLKSVQLNKVSFEKGVRGGKVFIFESGLGEKEMDRNREEIHGTYEGVEGSYGAFLALQGECDVQDLTLQNTTMEAKELREFVRDEFAAVIGMPLAKMGLKGVDIKESSFVERTFFEEEVKPILDLFQNKINLYLDLVGVQNYRFKFRRYTERDYKELARIADVAKRHGSITINEMREMLGLEKKHEPNCDRLFLQDGNGSYVFLEDIGKALPSSIPTMKDALTLRLGPRKVTRKNKMFPSVVEDETGEETTEEETGELHPFG